MSTHKEYALIAILATAAIAGVVPAFAANNPYLACPDCNDNITTSQIPQVILTVTTDKHVYDHNSQIMISGHVVNPYPGQDIALIITSPSGNVVTAAQVAPDNNGDFTKTVSTAGDLWIENGAYTIKAQQGNEQARVNSAVFQLAGEVTPSPPAIPEFGPIAALVLAIAIISIIAVSAKTGLRFMPKY